MVEDRGILEFDEKKNEEKGIKEVSESNERKLIEIKQLIVSPIPMRSILLGDVVGLVEMVNRKQKSISSIFWNESSITLMLREGNTEITFHPEFHKATTMFFDREEKRRGGYGEDAGVRVWEGEFGPVQFKKKDLLKFLNTYSSYFDEDLEKAIKNMRR